MSEHRSVNEPDQTDVIARKGGPSDGQDSHSSSDVGDANVTDKRTRRVVYEMTQEIDGGGNRIQSDAINTEEANGTAHGASSIAELVEELSSSLLGQSLGQEQLPKLLALLECLTKNCDDLLRENRLQELQGLKSLAQHEATITRMDEALKQRNDEIVTLRRALEERHVCEEQFEAAQQHGRRFFGHLLNQCVGLEAYSHRQQAVETIDDGDVLEEDSGQGHHLMSVSTIESANGEASDDGDVLEEDSGQGNHLMSVSTIESANGEASDGTTQVSHEGCPAQQQQLSSSSDLSEGQSSRQYQQHNSQSVVSLGVTSPSSHVHSGIVKKEGVCREDASALLRDTSVTTSSFEHEQPHIRHLEQELKYAVECQKMCQKMWQEKIDQLTLQIQMMKSRQEIYKVKREQFEATDRSGCHGQVDLVANATTDSGINRVSSEPEIV